MPTFANLSASARATRSCRLKAICRPADCPSPEVRMLSSDRIIEGAACGSAIEQSVPLFLRIVFFCDEVIGPTEHTEDTESRFCVFRVFRGHPSSAPRLRRSRAGLHAIHFARSRDEFPRSAVRQPAPGALNGSAQRGLKHRATGWGAAVTVGCGCRVGKFPASSNPNHKIVFSCDYSDCGMSLVST